MSARWFVSFLLRRCPAPGCNVCMLHKACVSAAGKPDARCRGPDCLVRINRSRRNMLGAPLSAGRLDLSRCDIRERRGEYQLAGQHVALHLFGEFLDAILADPPAGDRLIDRDVPAKGEPLIRFRYPELPTFIDGRDGDRQQARLISKRKGPHVFLSSGKRAREKRKLPSTKLTIQLSREEHRRSAA